MTVWSIFYFCKTELWNLLSQLRSSRNLENSWDTGVQARKINKIKMSLKDKQWSHCGRKPSDEVPAVADSSGFES